MALAQPDQAARDVQSRSELNDVTIIAHDIGPVGGMERQLVALITGLRRLGHRVRVIARTCVLPQSDEEVKGPAVEFHRVPGPSRPVLLAYPWFILAGSLMVRRWRRGVTHSTGAIVLNRVDAIAIHYCHQVGPTTPSRATLLFRLHAALTGQMTRAFERLCFAVNRKATYVCVSDGVADELRAHYPQLAERAVSIQNGVDTRAFAPGARVSDARELRASLRVPPDRLLAAFVGSEWERKGLEYVIRSLALLEEWDLVVAGGGDQQRYQHLADGLGVGGRVHWLGVSRDVQPVYESADALVFPSSYEAFSLVTLEAAASGLPILATAVNGVPELIADGESGYLIDQDPELIAERLRTLGADPALRARIGNAARESALRFSWERMVARHHELYGRLR